MEKEQLNLFDYVSNQGVQVLSLFDGMACGMLAMLESGIKVERYVAYEIDKYAVQTSTHNFPMIEQRGDVFKADFTEFKGFDYLIGGSPCTYWSIAQKNNRETEASGMGWELFSQYVRALHEAQPKYFVYENNKSMSKAIRASIDKAFGFEAVYINSALVSAQNRQRLYWVGRRNEDGTYSKVDVKQPEDRGILLRDILKGAVAWQNKSFCITATEYKGSNPQQTLTKHRRTMVAEPINITADGTYSKVDIEQPEDRGILLRDVLEGNESCRIPEYGSEDKARPINARYCGCEYKNWHKRVYSDNPNKQQHNHVAEPVAALGEQTDIVPFVEEKMPKAVEKYGYLPTMWNPYNNAEITDKSPTQTTGAGSQTTSATVMIVCCATPCEWDENGKPTKAISAADGKIYTVYEVKDGYITIKGKRYPIKLVDGFYIIRKLTVKECMRLQTVPEWYKFPVSDSQAYKMLGNGWTVSVISWLLNATKEKEK